MNIFSTRHGASMLIFIFIILIAGSLAIASLMLTSSGQRSMALYTFSLSSELAANSGIEWFREISHKYTTDDKDKFLALDSFSLAAPDGSSFTLQVKYHDTDNNPGIKDSVTLISTGTMESAQRSVTISVTVPVAANSSFIDNFDNADITSFDSQYLLGHTTHAHGGITPYVTAGGVADAFNLFTHQSESGGSPGILRMGGGYETRLMLITGDCFKWSMAGAGVCDYSGCASSTSCVARGGLKISKESNGYQNYFFKIRVRLITGDGFGVYFRASYMNNADPYLVNFSSLTGYIWQYDRGFGYMAPCSTTTSALPTNGAGMMITRRIDNGSELCGPDCAVYQAQASPATYPFYCPENMVSDPIIPGWGWIEANWINSWRTVYIYVYRTKANIYLGREEKPGAGGETDPQHIGEVALDSVGAMLKSGDVGLRTWGGSVIEIDYIKVYGNNNDLNPQIFLGD